MYMYLYRKHYHTTTTRWNSVTLHLRMPMHAACLLLLPLTICLL